jgi:platelet-activating factor acetylhydrolase IB subunit alpha
MTLRCWDLSQERRLVKTIDGAHGHFVSCIRWAPGIRTDVLIADREDRATTNRISKQEDVGKVRIRCVIATGSVDCNVRVFV